MNQTLYCHRVRLLLQFHSPTPPRSPQYVGPFLLLHTLVVRLHLPCCLPVCKRVYNHTPQTLLLDVDRPSWYSLRVWGTCKHPSLSTKNVVNKNFTVDMEWSGLQVPPCHVTSGKLAPATTVLITATWFVPRGLPIGGHQAANHKGYSQISWLENAYAGKPSMAETGARLCPGQTKTPAGHHVLSSFLTILLEMEMQRSGSSIWRTGGTAQQNPRLRVR